MTFASDPSSSVQAAITQATNQATNAALTNQAAPVAAATGMVNTSTATFNSLKDLQEKYPALYKAFIQSWAMQVVNQAKDANDRLIATLKEAEHQNSG
jgi:hypothetical protein